MNQDQRRRIAEEFQSCVDRTIRRIRGEDSYRPFHSALLSEDALFWSRFERSFSTSFGQSVIERISEICAISGGATHSQTQARTEFDIDNNHLNYIENHISQLRDGGGCRGNWEEDVRGLQLTPLSGSTQRIRVISDLHWRVNGINCFMSIKTVKPNIDQTAEAKRDLLKLKAFDPNCRVYFGLYYNPFGENCDYSWTPPMRIFNFLEDSCVLIGREYWDVLGGEGTYSSILEIAREVGENTRHQLNLLN